MEMRPLGRTGVQVSKLCLGAMMFGDWGTKDHDDSIKIIHRALDAGINFVDTADVYSQGESEIIVGKALAGRREDIVLATKAHMPMGEDPNHRGNSRRWITRAVEDSLRRLGTDWIDLYQIHRWDPAVDLDETLGALTDLVRAGKVRYLGHSTFPPSTIVEAQWTCTRPWPRTVRHRTAQLLHPHPRGRERDPAGLPALRHGCGPVQPARRRLALRPLPQGRRQTGPTSYARQRLANRFDLSLPEQPAQARGRRATRPSWPTRPGSHAHRDGDRVRAAPPGGHRADHRPADDGALESQLAAADVELSDDVLDRIDEIVPPGVTLNPADNGWVSPSLQAAARRR